MANKHNSWMQRGVYTPDQAARLLRIQPAMVTRWIYGSGKLKAAVLPEYEEHDGELITFRDLVQSMAIRAIRTQKQISLQKIRATVEAAKAHSVQFPFARLHTTYVFRDDMVLRLNDGRLIQVTGKYKNHDLMEPIVYDYLDDLGFDDYGLANIYTPIRRGFRSVQLSPSVNYGAPTVQPGAYTVATLINAFHAEGGIDKAANICDVNEGDIKIALEYEAKLNLAA